LTQAQTDLLVVDKNLPDGSGLLLARELSEKDVDAQVVVMSAYATLSSAVEALQAGVADYVLKPFDLADLRARLHRATEALKLRRANRRLLGELREKNALLEGLATRDPLTGLDNHASFQESVRREIARARRHGLSCALLLASIDRFRDINASLGFAGGDALLRALGAFLLRSGRASDVPAYLGRGVMARFAAAKQAGRNRIICWSPELASGGRLDPSRVRHEADRLAALGRSIREAAFDPVYQPIVDLGRRVAIAWEALARPTDPVFGSILDVLSVAERSGQIGELGRVLRGLQVARLGEMPESGLLVLNVHPFEVLGGCRMQ